MILSQKEEFQKTGFLSGKRENMSGSARWEGLRLFGWNLVAVTAGALRLECGGIHRIMPGTVFLIAPGRKRYFSLESPADFMWLHFPQDERFETRLRWRKHSDGVYSFTAAEEDFRRAAGEMAEAWELDRKRIPGWRALALNLVENVILRGNMHSGNFLRDERMEEACRMIDSGTPIDETAKQIGMSRAVFYRKFSAAFGISPAARRESERLRRARKLLETTDLSISEIADSAGLANIQYFSARFRKTYGISPSAYRAAARH